MRRRAISSSKIIFSGAQVSDSMWNFGGVAGLRAGSFTRPCKWLAEVPWLQPHSQWIRVYVLECGPLLYKPIGPAADLKLVRAKSFVCYVWLQLWPLVIGGHIGGHILFRAGGHTPTCWLVGTNRYCAAVVRTFGPRLQAWQKHRRSVGK